MIYTRWLLYGVVAFVVIQLLLQSRYPPPQITSGFVRRDLTNPAKRPSPPKKRTKATNTLPAHLGRGNEATGCLHQWAPPPTTVAAVVILTCNRPAYLERTLNTLLEVHSHDPQYATKFPLFVSQDGNNSEVAETLHAYTDALWAMEHVELQEPQRRLNRNENLAYYRIANHYKFVFLQMFDCLGFSNLIILEDDMEIAIDFFSFFERAAFLLAHDPSLYVVSSWNDHGQEAHVRDPYRLYRTDFFPGLGWMMPRRLWEEFADKWPAAYWDDWMREPQQRRGRESVYPEVCRNYNFGEHGSSKGQFFSKYLKPIRLNTVPVPWKDVDLRYLESDRCAWWVLCGWVLGGVYTRGAHGNVCCAFLFSVSVYVCTRVDITGASPPTYPCHQVCTRPARCAPRRTRGGQRAHVYGPPSPQWGHQAHLPQ